MATTFQFLTEAAGHAIDEAAAVHGAVHHESAFDPSGPEFWVYVGLTIFILLAIFVAKAPQKIAAALDARIAEAKRQLDEAKVIRGEAEALLAEAKKRHAASADDAANIVAQAETEAAALLTKAQSDAATLIERRSKMAEDKIAAAERQAIAEVRAKAADAAAAAAGKLIAGAHDAAADKALVDQTISGLSRLN